MDPVEVIAEFIGTLIYVYAISTSNNNPFGVAGCMYVSMVFTGFSSTPQFNPAVTLAMALRRMYHGEFNIGTAIQFTVNLAAQLLGAVLAALLAWGTSGTTFAFTVQSGFNHSEAFLAEMAYTAVICATCLTVRRVTESLFLSGIAIAVSYLTGILSIGNITLGCFNPAAAFALNFVNYAENGNKIEALWIFILAPLVGAFIGAAVAAVFIKIEDEDMIANRTKSLEGKINR